jgi:hypothetical protein
MPWKKNQKMDQKVMLVQQALNPIPIRRSQFDILPKIELWRRGNLCIRRGTLGAGSGGEG